MPSATTDNAHAVAGWLLHAEPTGTDVDALLARFGVVHRLPVSATGPLELLAPGQPCFLFRSNRSRVIGIWAVGEVVAEVIELPADLNHPAHGAVGPPGPNGGQCYAEIELLALEKPIGIDKLASHRGLAGSNVITAADHEGPLALTREQVRAIESFDFWIAEPTDEQRAAFDALLDAEDAAGY